MASFSSKTSQNSANNINFLKILGVSIEDSQSTTKLKSRFIELAKQTHPDVSSPPPNLPSFATIRSAFEALMDQAAKNSPTKSPEEATSNFDTWFRQHVFSASNSTLDEISAAASLSPGGLDKGGMWDLARQVAAEESTRTPDPVPLPPPNPPVYSSIESSLRSAFSPSFLLILNESHMHNVPPNSETHFKVVVVSPTFKGLKPLARHKLVNQALKEELEGPVHALSIVAKDEEQFEKMGGREKYMPESSPSCRGGDGSLPKRNEK
ncbi:hypothetical protein TrCOL_g5247 [Triparma columacea]|uniref:J domain-containing protein n=1 Tax=Triparma columacea TaxID=722753 RepID=A0A9W7L6M6_9STRA|nr:hypothetical protein TrCOL_g5247 [Triparma columacea]